METKVFKDYDEFSRRKDKSVNGVNQVYATGYPDYEQDNRTNQGCWNCRGCTDCIDCYACTNCSECYRANVVTDGVRLGGHAPISYKREKEKWERMFLETQYQRYGGNQTKMARELGMNRGSLRGKLRKYGLTTGSGHRGLLPL